MNKRYCNAQLTALKLIEPIVRFVTGVTDLEIYDIDNLDMDEFESRRNVSVKGRFKYRQLTIDFCTSFILEKGESGAWGLNGGIVTFYSMVTHLFSEGIVLLQEGKGFKPFSDDSKKKMEFFRCTLGRALRPLAA